MRRRVSRGVESARRRRRRGQIEAPKSPPRLKILLENTTNSYRVPLARPFFRSLLVHRLLSTVREVVAVLDHHLMRGGEFRPAKWGIFDRL